MTPAEAPPDFREAAERGKISPMASAVAAQRQRRPALVARLISGLSIGTALVAVAWLGGPLYALVVILLTGVGAYEAAVMLRSGGYRPFRVVLVALAVFLPALAFARPPFLPAEWSADLAGWLASASRQLDGGASGTLSAPSLLIAAVVLASLVALLGRAGAPSALVDWSVSLAMGIYLGILMQFYAPLRAAPDGRFWILALLAVSWSCDTAAYFVGGSFGRHRLAPSISPNKSVEGALGGLAGAVVAAATAALIGGHSVLNLVGFGLLLGIATILGDLAESLVKRQTGVKDAGALIPGHGGLLDRMDSLLFCAPAAVAWLMATAR